MSIYVNLTDVAEEGVGEEVWHVVGGLAEVRVWVNLSLVEIIEDEDLATLVVDQVYHGVSIHVSHAY